MFKIQAFVRLSIITFFYRFYLFCNFLPLAFPAKNSYQIVLPIGHLSCMSLFRCLRCCWGLKKTTSTDSTGISTTMESAIRSLSWGSLMSLKVSASWTHKKRTRRLTLQWSRALEALLCSWKPLLGSLCSRENRTTQWSLLGPESAKFWFYLQMLWSIIWPFRVLLYRRNTCIIIVLSFVALYFCSFCFLGLLNLVGD